MHYSLDVRTFGKRKGRTIKYANEFIGKLDVTFCFSLNSSYVSIKGKRSVCYINVYGSHNYSRCAANIQLNSIN